jgi:hypothetical protein
MTNTITLKLTFEELEQIDKYIELNDDTRQLFDKIRSAYPKSPVEAAYKRVFGEYPPTDPSVHNFDDNQWFAFQKGYSCGYGDGLENSNDFAISKKIVDKPEEKQSKTLTESWMNKPMNELVEILNKNPPDCLKFEMGKTLEQLIERWWCDVFVGPNEKWTMEECIADLCDRIHLWLPKEQSAAGSQSLGVEDMVEGFNDAIQKIKRKLR